MKKIFLLFDNRNAIFILALTAGLLFPGIAPWTKPLILPALAFVLALSTMGIPNEIFRRPLALVNPFFIGIVMSYAVLGSTIVVLGSIFIHNEMFFRGLVIMAAVPPAVAVIPFTSYLKGDLSLTLLGTVGAYLGGLIITPLAIYMLLDTTFINPVTLLKDVFVLILIPLAVSRILLWMQWNKWIDPKKGTLTNWGFFVALYGITGLNRDLIVGQPSILIPLAGILFFSTFILGFFIKKAGMIFKIKKGQITSFMLLGTLKNYGLTGGLALSLFGKEAALPAAVGTIFLILYVLWLDFIQRLNKRSA